MASFILENTRALIDGFDFSAQANQGNLKLVKDVKDATNFGSGGTREKKLGIGTADLDLTCFFDTSDPVNSIDPVLDAKFATIGTVITICPTTGLAGEISFPFVAGVFDLMRGFQFDELGEIHVLATGTGPSPRCTILEDGKTSRSTNSNTTGVQLGAVSATQTLYAAAHVLSAAGGSPSVALKVQSSSTQGGAYTDRITFTTQTVKAAEFKKQAGAVTDTWWRVLWVVGGASTFAVSVGIA